LSGSQISFFGLFVEEVIPPKFLVFLLYF